MAVYFIKDPMTDLIKIGYSFSVLDRLRILSQKSDSQLELLGVIAGSYYEEQKLHLQFCNSRVTGEWFSPAKELLSFIDRNAVPISALSEEVPNNIKSNIKALVERKDLTPSDFAHSAWIAWNTAKKMMGPDANIRKTPLETLVQVAQALDCEVTDLFEVSYNG